MDVDDNGYTTAVEFRNALQDLFPKVDEQEAIQLVGSGEANDNTTRERQSICCMFGSCWTSGPYPTSPSRDTTPRGKYTQTRYSSDGKDCGCALTAEGR